jgi:hypothetical protein
MLRMSPARTIGIVAGAVLLGAGVPATAQTTTTTPATTSTTTTLLPHPFSTATAVCIHQARAEQRACHRTGGTDCFTTFETAFANCFAPGAGVSCAKKCVTNLGKCFAKLPASQASCRKACVTANKADVLACRRIANGDNIWAGGDASCLSTAQANLDLCRAVCAGLGVDCQTALKFCVANCQNL